MFKAVYLCQGNKLNGAVFGFHSFRFFPNGLDGFSWTGIGNRWFSMDLIGHWFFRILNVLGFSQDLVGSAVYWIWIFFCRIGFVRLSETKMLKKCKGWKLFRRTCASALRTSIPAPQRELLSSPQVHSKPLKQKTVPPKSGTA